MGTEIKTKYTLEYLNDGIWWEVFRKHSWDYADISLITPKLRRSASKLGNGKTTRIIQHISIEIVNVLNEKRLI